MKKVKHNGLCVALTLISLLSAGQNKHSWFDIQLDFIDCPMNEQEDKTIRKYIYDPFVRVHLPEKEKATGRAVVICPGGGYSMVVSGHEGNKWGEIYNEQGIAAIVFTYRLPYGNYKIPVFDAEAALKLVADSAKCWNINPNEIGIMGFSAGGHLASTIATHSNSLIRPKFQILFYPVITMDKSFTHMGSHDNFLGKDASTEMEDLFSNEKQVDSVTPPAFIVLAADDKVAPPENGINYFCALNGKNIPASIHIYPEGNHGWGYRRNYEYKEVILNELFVWLDNLN